MKKKKSKSFRGCFLCRSLYKSIAAVILFVLCIVMTGCSLIDDYFVKKSEYNTLQAQLNDANKTADAQMEKIREIENKNEALEEEKNKTGEEIDLLNSQVKELKSQLDAKSIQNLEKQIEKLEGQPKKLKNLLNNINDLLKNVYIGSSAPEELAYTFTAFTISYKAKTYIITAGHCVADNYGKEGAFKFKANFSDNWLYPDLLGYKAEFYNLDDYGVFYADGMSGGFEISDKKTEDQFLLGSIDKGLSIVRNLGDSSRRGESGSPVINEDGEVIGIYVVYGLEFTPIQLVLNIIDKTEIKRLNLLLIKSGTD